MVPPYTPNTWNVGDKITKAKLDRLEQGLVDADVTNLASPAAAAVAARHLTQFHGARYTAFGHSFGQVQNPVNAWAGSLYPARLRDLLHADTGLYVNRTVSGAKMADAATSANTNWVDGNGGLVTIMANQNDVGNKTSAATFKSGFRALLTTLLGSTGKPPTVLVIKDTTCTATGYARYFSPYPTDADVATYNGYLDAVIAEFPTGWILVADPLGDGWNPATMTAPDGQHPNDLGMAFITQSCLKALRAAPYRPGQNPGLATPLIAAAPGALSITATPGDSQVTVAATGGSGATSYALYRGTVASGTPIATAFPFTDTGRTNGTAVSYVATATNAQGSVTSNVATTTPAAAGGGSAVTDSFNRADSTSTLGSADSGQAWSVLSGAFGISSNQAYKPTASSAGEDVAVLETSKADFDLSITCSVISGGAGCGPAFRVTDASNFWCIDVLNGSAPKLYKRVGGAYTAVLTLGSTNGAAGDVFRVVTSGSSITVYRNGTQVGTATDSFNSTATKHGMRIAGTSANSSQNLRLDNLSIA